MSPATSSTLARLPSRAFDSPAQHAETAALAADYNTNGYDLTPQIDAAFARLAAERIARAPPALLRLASPGPRRRHVAAPARRKPAHRPRLVGLRAPPRRNTLQLGLCCSECALPVARCCGLCSAPPFWRLDAGLHASAQRSPLTVVPPEARYTLECFPMLFALGGVALARFFRPRVAI